MKTILLLGLMAVGLVGCWSQEKQPDQVYSEVSYRCIAGFRYAALCDSDGSANIHQIVSDEDVPIPCKEQRP